MRVRAAAIAVLLMTTSPAVAQSTAGFTLGEWTSLGQRDRHIALVAAIEGLLLVSRGPDAQESGIDTDCLIAQKLDDLDTRMRAAAASAKDRDFVNTLLETSQCSRS